MLTHHIIIMTSKNMTRLDHQHNNTLDDSIWMVSVSYKGIINYTKETQYIFLILV